MAVIKHFIVLLMMACVFQNNACAQYAIDDEWYNNPLGFEPVNMHTSMGFIIPAVAVGTCLLLTKRDTALAHRLSIYNETGLGWGYKYPYSFMPQNNTGINFLLRRFMSIGVEFDVYAPRDEYNKTIGFAIRPFARFYAFNRETWRLYFESGGGFVYFPTEYPKPTPQDDRLGTQWNGTTKYGIGSEINIAPSTALMFGVRHLHVSNGNTKGVERNPSHDSNGFFVGLSAKL